MRRNQEFMVALELICEVEEEVEEADQMCRLKLQGSSHVDTAPERVKVPYLNLSCRRTLGWEWIRGSVRH